MSMKHVREREKEREVISGELRQKGCVCLAEVIVLWPHGDPQ